MQVVQTAVGNNGPVGNVVTSQFHGVNLLFHNDTLDTGSDLRQVIQSIGTSLIRYPGGTIAEEYFDLADPNAVNTPNVIDLMHGESTIRVREDVITLSEYLNYETEIQSKPIIVVPTYRYFDLATGGMAAGAEVEIKTFLRKLLTDQYGPVDSIILEIGNEFYQTRFNWTLEQFSALQANIGEWLNEEAIALGVRDQVTILGQAGRSLAENHLMASYFLDDDGPSIDGVITHLYGTNSSGDLFGIGSGVSSRLENIDEAWSAALGADFLLAVTEWNVGESGEETTLINGLMRTAPLLRLYAEMIEHGVDIATIWAAQTSGPAGLSDQEGRGASLSPTGYFYSMMVNATEGKNLITQGSGDMLQNAAGADVGYSYTFMNAAETVTYFASGVNDSVQISADMSQFFEKGDYIYAIVLGAAPGTTGIEYDAQAATSHLTQIKLDGGVFNFTLKPYEMVELHIVTGTGADINADAQNAIADALRGSQFGDDLSGGLGNDMLSGNRGEDTLSGGGGSDVLNGRKDNDQLFGGDGADFLYGERGRDKLWGGDGNDRMRGNEKADQLHGQGGSDSLFGGADEDVLFGGEGRDYLHGEDGTDTLDGGTGNDMLTGGADADQFVFRNSEYGYDHIRDFEIGTDKIDLSTFNFTDVSQVKALGTNTAFGFKIDFGGGNVLFVENTTGDQLQSSDFLL